MICDFFMCCCIVGNLLCIIFVISDEKYASKRSAKKESSSEKVHDKIRDKQDDAFAFAYGVATSGTCDRCSKICFSLIHLNAIVCS